MAGPAPDARAPGIPARRINVRGASGSGKTTVAAEAAECLGIPHIQLDALYWVPGWSETPAEEFRERVRAAMAQTPDGWVIDGNYHSRIGDLVVEAADTVLRLDLPLHVTLRRLWKRTIDRLRRRIDRGHGNRESWREHFTSRQSLFLWSIRSHRQFRREWPVRLASHPGFVRLRSDAAIRRWLAATCAAAPAAVASDTPTQGGSEDRQQTGS